MKFDQDIRHTYLFQEGIWEASGYSIGEANRRMPVEGESHIVHMEDRWETRAHMTVLGETTLRYENNYEVKPFAEDVDFTEWVSLNPAIGKLRGKLVVVADAIISNFRSDDSIYSGSEYLQKIDDLTYLNRGFMFEGEQKRSSWSVKLKKVT